MTELYLRALGEEAASPVRTVTPHRLAGWIIMPPRSGTLVTAPRECPFGGVEEYTVHPEDGTVLADANLSTDAIMSAVVVGDRHTTVSETLHDLGQWFTESTEIVPARVQSSAGPR